MVLVSAMSVAAGLFAAPAAHAAGYRYWSFWQADGESWAYATQGPATTRPEDGEVSGFRFSVSADSADSAEPRTAPRFAELCAGTPAKEGTKRVGVVVDFGTAEDAPPGESPPAPDRRTACARIDTSATSADALAAVAKPLRYNSAALLCAISGYPEAGCGEQVADKGDGTARKNPAAPASADGGGDGTGPSVGLFAGIAAVLALGGGAFVQARRRRGSR
jgi:hypothetical protein